MTDNMLKMSVKCEVWVCAVNMNLWCWIVKTSAECKDTLCAHMDILIAVYWNIEHLIIIYKYYSYINWQIKLYWYKWQKCEENKKVYAECSVTLCARYWQFGNVWMPHCEHVRMGRSELCDQYIKLSMKRRDFFCSLLLIDHQPNLALITRPCC